ncbi:hypothetical protein Verru16b_00202 [Lacunisphaera limnophila]|uniref:DUF1428 domain-containing protein n=1 Tax=Lacunisphaera limnophila TaxID=1838286 RepID=A0A1I7PHR9_9BACT|nr:DUF1428 domain-containing protein [Lacunisphaera limnophila]AOS43161.1 hypothetical protein Verru16b_00202 [Lacunisphaera limnophila]
MPRYIDGFVLPLKKKNLAAYRRIAAKAGKIWKKYGALDYVEAVGDDLKIPGMETSFPGLAKSKPGETVVFSFITYKSRADRDRVTKRIMQDPEIMKICDPKKSPFDFQRMAYGGFKAIVEL